MIAFWTVFNVGWGVGDYQWLHDFCRERLTGERLLIWHFNEGTMTDEVRSFYRSIAEFSSASQSAAGKQLLPAEAGRASLFLTPCFELQTDCSGSPCSRRRGPAESSKRLVETHYRP